MRFALSGLRTNEQMVHFQRFAITVPQIAAIVMAVFALIAISYITRLPVNVDEPAVLPRPQVRPRPRRT
jgi:hypothetical protein